jgi:uncharacterized membrane protein (UPF0127 family)
MFGMSYAIDALFLDRNDVVVGLVQTLKPGQMSRICWKAKSCLELPAGTISGTDTKLGDKVEFGQ